MSDIIYWTDISRFPDPAKDPSVTKGLPQERIDKILNLKREISRKQSLCSALLQKYVAEMHGKSINDIYFGEHGKPLLDGVFFNVSHSGNIVVCALGDYPIGCDIELIRKTPKSVINRAFHKGEIQVLRSLSPEDSEDRGFFRLWTAKESYIKLIGAGLAYGMKKIYMYVTPYKNPHHIFAVNGNISAIFLKEYKIPQHENYVLFICTENRDYDAPLKRLYKKNLI